MRSSAGQSTVCLVLRHRHGGPAWCLPKGHVESGENLRTAAEREVREETGWTSEIIRSLGEIRYQFTPSHGRPTRQREKGGRHVPKGSSPRPQTSPTRSGVPGRAARGTGFTHPASRATVSKHVTFFLMRTREATGAGPDTAEVDEARWMTIDEALAMATYENERAILLKAKEHLEEATLS